MSYPQHVKIVEVSARDGLQNEPTFIPTALKLQLIEQLSASGLTQIETTSFVSPDWVPQLADHSEVQKNTKPHPGIDYVALTPNREGLTNAIDAGAKHVAVFTACTDSFSKRNTNKNRADSLAEIKRTAQAATEAGLAVRGYLSCVMGCPFEGHVEPSTVAELAQALFLMGCNEVSLGDTIGVGNPIQTRAVIKAVRKYLPIEAIALHCHDTYGQALANIFSGLEEGVHVIDASAGGLGGCPFAPGAGGNVATEDVLFLCDNLGIETGVSIDSIAKAGSLITDFLQIAPRSKASVAIQSSSNKQIKK